MFIKRILTASLVSMAVGSSFAGLINAAASVNGGVASGSTQYTASDGASNAIDGNEGGNYYVDHIYHSNPITTAFVQSAFSGVFNIVSVRLFNRTDCCSDRINTFDVSLWLNGSEVWSQNQQTFVQDTTTGTSISGVISGETFKVPGVNADTVMVRLDGTNYLQVAELEAWGNKQAVPEPMPLALLAFGGIYFAFKHRK